MNALLPERTWRVASLWPAFARKLSLQRADRVLHRQPGRPLVGVGDRNEPANRVGARLDVELHIAAGPEQPPLRRRRPMSCHCALLEAADAADPAL
jgi:hypothetical protein